MTIKIRVDGITPNEDYIRIAYTYIDTEDEELSVPGTIDMLHSDDTGLVASRLWSRLNLFLESKAKSDSLQSFVGQELTLQQLQAQIG